MVIRDTDAFQISIDYERGTVALQVCRPLTSEESYALGLALRDASLCLNNYSLELKRYEERQKKRKQERIRRTPMVGDPLPMEEDDETE